MIVTFYSFKGGVGRSMAMANVAELLADAGYNVILCDWDLEAPGLERYMASRPGDVRKFEARLGLMDLLEEYKQTMTKPAGETVPEDSAESGSGSAAPKDFKQVGKLRLRRPSALAFNVSVRPDRKGSLRLLTAGRRDGKAYQHYAEMVRTFDWDEFYDKWAGDSYMEFFRSELTEEADVVLIDSRTGVTEQGGVCTHHLADLVVLLCASNEMNLAGTDWMAGALTDERLRELRGGRPLKVMPVPSRIEPTAQVEELVEFRNRFKRDFGAYVRDMNFNSKFFEDTEIPYMPYYSFKERVVAREPEKRREIKLYSAYDALAKAITKYGLDSGLLRRTPRRARRPRDEASESAEPVEGLVLISNAWESRKTAELLARGLTGAGVKVWTSQMAQPGEPLVQQFERAAAGAVCQLILFGGGDFNRWARAEFDSARRRMAEQPDFRLIPIILPGVEARELPPALMRLRTIQLPEKLTDDDRDFFKGLVEEIGAEAGSPRAEENESPFVGWGGFEEEQARFFFGRDADTAELVQMLGETPSGNVRWLQIEGPNGSGKSSLARAGLIPAVRRGWVQGAPKDWKVFTVARGNDLIESLTVTLYDPSIWSSPADLQSQLNEGDKSLSAVLRQLTTDGRPLLLLLDGLDEALVGPPAAAPATKQFDRLLAAALSDDSVPFYLVTTLRCDLSGRMSALPELEALMREKRRAARYRMKPLSEAAIYSAMRGPARMAGLAWESGLPERIAAEVVEAKEPPAVLGHLLRTLWEKRVGPTLTHGAYQEFGGLRGLLTVASDRALEELSLPGQERARQLLLSAVKVGRGLKVGQGTDDTRLSVPVEEALAAASGGPEASRALTRLLAPPYVLVVNEDRQVELLHESLARHWPTLRNWVDANRDAMRRRDELEAAARAWEAAGRPAEDLPRDEMLRYYERALTVGERARRFLAAATHRAETQRDTIITTYAGGGVVEQKPIARKFPPLLPERVSLSRLPVTGRDLFGREEEFALLDRSWEDETINVISFVAWGGVGKSALVNHWLRGMRRDNYRGAERVYAWSFYQQGVGDRAVSADQFVDAALRWFGDPDPTAGSPWDKGERLARLVRNQRTLLLLDGLEPLQFPPGPDEGRFKDQAMQALLRELASFNPGMCVITSRISPTDLADYEGDTVLSVNLENLSPQTGAAMLSAQGVKGTQAELEEASDEFGGHALALTLLGGYLTNVYDGDVRQRDKVRILREDEERGGLTQALMASYEKWFAEESPELAILRLLGLFDRPADAASIASVRAAPAIQGLTDTLQDLSDEQWQRSLRRLREANLVSDRDPQQPDALDAHPLIREYFRGQLKQRNPDAWREGNSRLFEHLRSSTVEFPETLEEMMPLYAAVGYGCEAGRHQEVFTTVYLRRILREQRNFSVRNLGAFGAELAALTSFFDPPWQRPVEGLSESDKGFVMSQAGNCLRALGRLAEAAQPLSYALETQTRMSNWEAASLVAANFNRLQLTVGDISGALDYAGRCVEFAERSGSILWTAAGRAVLADTLHHAGRMSEAENIFREVEETQKRSRPEAAFLVSLHGFNYCDLLLDEGKYAEARVRAEASLALAEQNHWLLELALGYLSLGRADLLEAKQEGARDFVRPAQLLDRAVSLFRQAGQLDYLPHGLLARAELFRALGDFGRARADVEEAMSIATRGGMRLHQADCHLEFARLLSAQDDKPKAREHLLKAREMIERMGYHRRDEAVREIEAWLEEAGE